MKTKWTALALMGVLGLGGAAVADTIQLTGVVRDFKVSHPDMQRSGPHFNVVQGMVKPLLGPDRKPVLNAGYATLTKGQNQGSLASVTVDFHGTFIDATSTRDLSNVVLGLSNGVEYKYDELDQSDTGKHGRFLVPEEHEGATIETVWVKSGSYTSDDGPGYGYRFDLSEAQVKAIPSSFRVQSVNSFNQWYRDVVEVNIALPYTITLDNGQDEPGGVYTFAVERPNYFFPIDGKGWNQTATDANGQQRNFYFTFEIHTKFTYSDPGERDEPMTFRFTGDDDVWVFINGKLAVDIGGVHPQASDQVNVDDMADYLGLTPGGTYELSFFLAERHTTESNVRIETTMQLESIPPTTVSPLYD